MDFITGLWSSTPGWGVGLVLAATPFFMPNSVLHGAGKTLGALISTTLRQKVGKGPGEKVERYFQGTLAAFLDGLNEGMDADD